MDAAAVIETHELSKTYKRMFRKPSPALADVSVSVERGVIFGLLGQNGAGKTTLVKILLGLVLPTAGRARVLGHSPRHAVMRRKVGYLPEQMRLPDFMRAEGFLTYMGRMNGVERGALRRRIPALLDLVGLPGEKKLLKEYSKGMLQRLGLAQALINEPDVIFLDEPTEGLDPLGRKQVRDLLVTLRAAGKTIFLNSHLLSEIELVCDRVLILHKGRAARSGTPQEFTRHTGNYAIRVAQASDAARAAAAEAAPGGEWTNSTLQFAPRDLQHLNAMIDRLRAAEAQIEAVEPQRSTLEEFFIEVVAGEKT